MEKLKTFFGNKVNVISTVIGWVVLLGVVGCVITIILLNGYDLAEKTDKSITYTTVTENFAQGSGTLLDNNRVPTDTTVDTIDDTGVVTTVGVAEENTSTTATELYQIDGKLGAVIGYYNNDDTYLNALKAALASGQTIKLLDADGNVIAETTEISVIGNNIVALFDKNSSMKGGVQYTVTGPTVKNSSGTDVTISIPVTVPLTGSFSWEPLGAYKIIQTKLNTDIFGLDDTLTPVSVEFNNTDKTDKVNRGRLDGHDLCCFYDEATGYYYSYGTDAEIGQGTSVIYGSQYTTLGLQVRRSKDLVNWEFVGWALDGAYPLGATYTVDGATRNAVGLYEEVENASVDINGYNYLYDEATGEYVVKYQYYTKNSSGEITTNQSGEYVVNTYIGTGFIVDGKVSMTSASGTSAKFVPTNKNGIVLIASASDLLDNSSASTVSEIYTSSVGEGVYSLQNFLYDGEYEDGQHSLWAPDVYKADTGKYVMYFSCTETFGSSNSVIYYATSDSAESGFTVDDNNDGTITMSELKNHMVINSYISGPNAIDASVAYDGNGNPYLAYGSYGGIYIVELSQTTSDGVYLPADSAMYKESGVSVGVKSANGTKLATRAGGETNQEGSSILTVKDSDSSTGYYYYLFTTNNDLYSTYDVRVSRSENITGPYADYNGNAMLTGTASYYNYQSQSTSTIGSGTKLMSSYVWSSSLVGNKTTHGTGTWEYAGFIAPGHGTWFYDADGNVKFIHHTREGGSKSTASDGTVTYNNHYLVVRDLEFVDTGDNGTWPVFSPGWYAGEGSLQDGSMNEIYDTSYSDILGEWEYIVFTENASDSTRAKLFNTATFTKSGGTTTADGSITGAKVSYGDMEGTWSFDASTKQLTVSWDDAVDGSGNNFSITLTAKVMVGWDIENSKSTIMFSGIDDTGIAHWGKRAYN